MLFTLIAFVIGLGSVFLENYLNINQLQNFNFFYLMLSGFTMSIGVVVPGVSSTIILMLFGIYSTYLSSISTLYLPVLIPIGIGLFLGSIVFMKVTRFLLDNFYPQTFFTIIGFTLGSIIVLVPEVGFDLSAAICFLCIIFGFNLSKLISV